MTKTPTVVVILTSLVSWLTRIRGVRQYCRPVTRIYINCMYELSLDVTMLTLYLDMKGSGSSAD